MSMLVFAVVLAGFGPAHADKPADDSAHASKPSAGASLLPRDTPIHAAIDHYINRRLADTELKPAPVATPATLARRTTLDLVGRIPTVAEARAFVEASDPGAARHALVDRLMASPGYVRQTAHELDTMLMHAVGGSMYGYLEHAVRNDTSWDRIFADVIAADATDGPKKQAAEMLLKRVKDKDKLTNDVSVLFFGVNVSCAQCHDHPHVKQWTQQTYYGIKAFFNRTIESGGFIGEEPWGEVDYKTVKGESRKAAPMFFTGATIDEPAAKGPTDEQKKAFKQAREESKKQKKPLPAPAFSRRAKFIEVALADEQRVYLARAIVNRVWHRLMGHGLVMPLDQMHDENPPSHPALMAWLARDVLDHGFDLRRLTRGIVMSDAYARSSRWTKTALRPRADLFAVAHVRPLTPRQYGVSLKLASYDPQRFAADLKTDELQKRIADIEKYARGLESKFVQPGEHFQVSADEALLLSNSDSVSRDLLHTSGERLVGALEKIDDDRRLVETAVWTVMSRPGETEEVDALTGYLAKRKDRRASAIQQLVWSLMTSAEFRFNH